MSQAQLHILCFAIGSLRLVRACFIRAAHALDEAARPLARRAAIVNVRQLGRRFQ